MHQDAANCAGGCSHLFAALSPRQLQSSIESRFTPRHASVRPGGRLESASEPNHPPNPGPSAFPSQVVLTFSCDLDTLPLFSTSRAVKAYQMDFKSSARRSMARGTDDRGCSVNGEDPVSGNRLPRFNRPQRGIGRGAGAPPASKTQVPQCHPETGTLGPTHLALTGHSSCQVCPCSHPLL